MAPVKIVAKRKPQVYSGTPAICRSWDQKVHRDFIAVPGQSHRADWDWNWNMIPIFAFLGSPGRKPIMFQLQLEADGYPLGMAVLLQNMVWPLDPTMMSTYLFYLTAAPKAAVASRGDVKPLMQAIFDVALTHTINGRNKGRIWLHADPAGADLPKFYEKKIGMKQIPRDRELPRAVPFVERRNDGRFYYLDEKTAKVSSANMDGFR